MTEDPLWGDDWESLRASWTLDPGVAFLNHGSYGACPRPVLEEQARWRAELERQPVQFFDRRLPGLLEEVRARIAAFLRAEPEGVAFVSNATTGTATVLASIRLEPGDEVLVTDHGYPAVFNAVARRCEQAGASMVLCRIPLPLPEPAAITSAIAATLSERTKLAIVDHATSPTAAIFPIRDIVAACRARGVPILVDAAHAPGMIDVDVGALEPDFWTGNMHKWVSAPKGSAVLWVAPERRATTPPLVTSHGYGRGLRAEFDWTGTGDPSPILSVPAALDFWESLGWQRVREHNHRLAELGRETLARALGSPQLVAGDAFGSMAIVALPAPVSLSHEEALAFSARVFDGARVEVPFFPWNGRVYVRLSAQVYNLPADYTRLAEALPRFL